MTSMESTEKFLAEGLMQKLEGQLYPVCEKLMLWALSEKDREEIDEYAYKT